MKRRWVRRDFSKESQIKETLLEELLARRRDLQASEISDSYLDKVAAAGLDQGEMQAMEELKKKLDKDR